MPVRFRDTCICEKCKKEFEWVYFELERQNLNNSMLYVEKIPNNRVTILNINDNKFEFSALCPHCNYDNIFDYDKP